MQRIVHPGAIYGALTPPADKSISHRALLFSALASGTSRIKNLLMAQDIEATRSCLELLGVHMSYDGVELVVEGKSGQLDKATEVLNCQNSGTTMRLLAGILAGQPFSSLLVGDVSLNRRPIARVLEPLRAMGARAYATPAGTPPVLLVGGPLNGVEYTLPVASAQLKTAILLAAVGGRGETVIQEPVPSRDHSERMLTYMGIEWQREGSTLRLPGPQMLQAREHVIPGDFSSAAPWITAALLAPDSRVALDSVGLNPTRTGLLRILQRMGANIVVMERQESDVMIEPWGDLVAISSELRGTDVEADEIPTCIDEIPLLVVAACFARGRTRIQGVEELRLKESDRISGIVKPLLSMGAEITVDQDCIVIEGQGRLQGAAVDAGGDHRIAMALAVAGVAAESPVQVAGAEWVQVSYPTFWAELQRLQGGR